jgi:hypothetical protein
VLWLRRLFHRAAPREIETELLAEAQLAHIDHKAAAEHHQALADMYAARIERLTTGNTHDQQRT